VDSTNNYAMGQAQAGLAYHGAAWFAREQTAGKGQRSKRWVATPNDNILLSLVLQPFMFNSSQQFLLSVTISLACYDFYKNYAGTETSIKWPNDIYWRDRKAGGILIENSFRGREWLFAIAGIGININQTTFDTSLPNPVSLKQITGKTFDPVELAKELCAYAEKRYQQLVAGGEDELLKAYEAVLYKRLQPVTLRKDGQLIVTTIEGVTPNGRLVTRDAVVREFDFNEVEWVIG
jgi:BirA family biotin operon repressor/biotin-[acetyl-CoA-carboxylase] ligase